jgi:hypothetical protein
MGYEIVTISWWYNANRYRGKIYVGKKFVLFVEKSLFYV